MEQALPLLARIEQLDPQSWMPQLIRGYTEAAAQHHQEAVEAYRRALARGGSVESIAPLLGASLLALGQEKEATTVLAEAYAKKPDSFSLLMAYAAVVYNQGDYPKAKVLLPKLLAKEPNLYTPNMNWVKILWAENKHDEALPYLQRVVRLYPDDVASRGLLAQYYLEKSDPLPAILPLEQALPHAATGSREQRDLTGMLVTAYLQAGRTEGGRGNWPAAAQYAERAIALDPAGLLAYNEKAIACSQLKQFRRAAEALQKMADLLPDHPVIQLNLGDACYRDGAADEARQHWQRALQLAGADDAALRDALTLRLNGQMPAETFK
jgi:tetratricopeptide (TPR) repeat protein